jgi:ATP-binding cassette subfamily B protein
VSAPSASAIIEGCAWPLAEREALADRLAERAGIKNPGPSERFELGYADVTPSLSAKARATWPAVLRAGAGAGVLLGVAGVRGDDAQLIARDGRVVSCPLSELTAFIRAPAEAEARAGLEATVARAGLGAPVVRALCVAALGAERVAEGTRLAPARPSMRAALAGAGVARAVALAFAGYLAQLGLFAGLWYLVGARAVAAADARQGGGFAAAIAGVIVLLVATRLLASWTAGRLAIDVGRVLRVRLLDGLFALDTERIRAQGIGQLLGRVVDTEALESLALGGGLAAAAGVFELATGCVVLALGVAAVGQLALAAAWAAVMVWLALRAQRTLARWTALRLRLTHDLVERMVGQRTLVIQQPPELWHRDEDVALAEYARAGRALDGALAALAVVGPRGWLLAAVAVLAPSLPAAATRPGAFATSLGGALLAYGALRKLAQAFPALAAARLAWREAREMLDGAPHPNLSTHTAASRGDGAGGEERATSPVLIEGHDVAFGYPGRAEAVLRGCDFQIRRGDRVLLEGPSGGGKSTLGALLAGLRAPDAGELALGGQPQNTLGLARWRTRVGAAPQFHENHVFSASVLFNLLLGRAWPPRREDVAEAEAVLRELDLGPLLERMPSGLEQLVGESGWQLSHGEKSRLYIARSLLQPLEARVLDESFAALDPETLERALACVLRRAETLVVIAHP